MEIKYNNNNYYYYYYYYFTILFILLSLSQFTVELTSLPSRSVPLINCLNVTAFTVKRGSTTISLGLKDFTCNEIPINSSVTSFYSTRPVHIFLTVNHDGMVRAKTFNMTSVILLEQRMQYSFYKVNKNITPTALTNIMQQRILLIFK